MIITGNSNVSLFRLGKLVCGTSPEPVQVHWVGALRAEHFFSGHPAAAKVRESFAREKGWKLLSLGTHDVFSLCQALSEKRLPEAQAQLIRCYQSLFRELGNDGKLAWIVFSQPPRQVAFPGVSEQDIVSVAKRFYEEMSGWCGQNRIAVVNPTGKLVEVDGTPKAKFLQQDGIHLNASAFDLYAEEIALQVGQQVALLPETSRQRHEPNSEPESFALLVAQELGLSWSPAAVEASTPESFEEALLVFLRQRLEERGLPASLDADTDFVGPRLLDSLDLVETYTYANDLLGAEIDFDVNLRDLNTVRKLAGKLFSDQNLSVDDLLEAARQEEHGGQCEGCAADRRIARMEREGALRLRDIIHTTLGNSIPYGVAHFWLALIEESTGNRSKALRHLAQASDKGLRFPLLGWRPEHYRKLWQSDPSQQEESFLVSAREYFLRGELSLGLLRSVDNKTKEYTDFELVKALNQQGEELLRAANYKIAKYAFDKTLEIAPHYGPAYRNLGLLHWKQERPHDADSCFRLAISANADDGQNILVYAEFLLATRRVEEAKAVAGAFFERHPDNPEVAEWLRRRREAETPVTAQRLSFSLRTTPEAPNMDRLNAEIISAFQHFQQERWEEALTHFQQARKLSPRKQGLHLAMARCLLKLERTTEARVALQEELSIKENHPDALKLLHELGRQSESVPSVPLGALPANDFLEGAKYFECGDWLGALACFDRVLAKENRKRGVNCLRGQCLLRLGRKIEARRAFHAELSVQPNHPDALRFLQELGHSDADPAQTANAAYLYQKGLRLLEASELSKALECLDEALRQDATLQGAQLTRAYCFEKMGRLTEAEAAVRQEILQHPENAEARKLFHALRKTARPKKAFGNEASMPQVPSGASVSPMPRNESVLEKQRQLWNVGTMYEAMFHRVYSDQKILSLSSEEQMSAFQASAQRSADLILRDLPTQPSWKLLEILCGVGRLVKPLRERFAEVDGVDIAANMIEFATQYLSDGKGNGRLLANNGSNLQPLPSNYYDLVYSMIVFQHIRSVSVVRSYFSEVARVLVPGGYFRLQVYDKSNPAMGTFNEEALRDRDYGMIGNGYSPEELRALLAEHGLEIVSLEHTKPWIWATACRPGSFPTAKPSLSAESLRVSEIPQTASAGYPERAAQHFARREWKLALVCFDQMSETGLQQPNLHYLRAQCLFQLGRWKECERAIFAELKIQPNHPDTRGLLRELRQQQKPVAVEA